MSEPVDDVLTARNSTTETIVLETMMRYRVLLGGSTEAPRDSAEQRYIR